MPDNEYGETQVQGSLASIPQVEEEFDDWGVDWIQASSGGRADESSIETRQQGSDQKPNSASQTGKNRFKFW